MDISLFKEELFKEVKKNGFEECEIFYLDVESLSLNIYEGEVEKYKLNNVFGLFFRGKINGKMGYFYIEILDKDVIFMFINNVKGVVIVIENDDV